MTDDEINECHDAEMDALEAGWRWSWTVVPVALVDLATNLAGAVHESLQALLTEVSASHVFARNQKIFEATTLREIESIEEVQP